MGTPEEKPLTVRLDNEHTKIPIETNKNLSRAYFLYLFSHSTGVRLILSV